MVHSRWLILLALIATWALGSMSSQSAAPQFPCLLEVTAPAGYVCLPPAALAGPPGATGATGPQGPQGPTGPAGAPGTGITGQACNAPATGVQLYASLPGGTCLPILVIAAVNTTASLSDPQGCPGYGKVIDTLPGDRIPPLADPTPCIWQWFPNYPPDGTMAGVLHSHSTQTP